MTDVSSVACFRLASDCVFNLKQVVLQVSLRARYVVMRRGANGQLMALSGMEVREKWKKKPTGANARPLDEVGLRGCFCAVARSRASPSLDLVSREESWRLRHDAQHPLT